MAMANADWDDLDQFLGDVDDADLDRWGSDGTFEPDLLDADKANRMLRKLRRLQQWKTNTVDTANAEITRIGQWRDGRERMIGGEIARLESALEGYMRALNRQNPKLKTSNLPNGTLKLRAPRTRVIVDEPDTALNFVLDRVAETTGIARGDLISIITAMQSEPMLAVTVSAAAGEIGKRADKGESRGVEHIPNSAPLNNYAAVLKDDGTLVPGVYLQSFADDVFGVTVKTDDTPEADSSTTPGEDEL